MYVIEPSTPAQWQAYYDLRWRILRKPWNEPRGSEQDTFEKSSIHRAIFNDNKIIAIGRLHSLDNDTGQVRYMAVENEYTSQGYGSAILEALELAAKERHLKQVILNARQTARAFYEKHGYSIIGDAHTLFNAIPHYKMSKSL